MDVIKECSTSFPTSDFDSWIEMFHIFSRLECNYMKVKNEENSFAIDDDDHALIIETSGCPWPKATLKPRCENPGPKVEIPSPENHVLKTIS
jgi:hypothetical protein